MGSVCVPQGEGKGSLVLLGGSSDSIEKALGGLACGEHGTRGQQQRFCVWSTGLIPRKALEPQGQSRSSIGSLSPAFQCFDEKLQDTTIRYNAQAGALREAEVGRLEV